MELQRTGLAKISQRLAAVQYFDPAERRFGSTASHRQDGDGRPMSAMPPRATEQVRRSETPLCAISGCEQSQQTNSLFDLFIGAGEHSCRYVEADRLRSSEVDRQLVLGGRLHRQVGR